MNMKRNKRLRPIPPNVQEMHDDARRTSTEHEIKMLRECFDHHGLSSSMQTEFFQDLSNDLQLNFDSDVASAICISSEGQYKSDITLVKGIGRRIFLRKSENGQQVEIGKYDDLEDALSSLIDQEPKLFPKPVDPDESETEDLWCTFCLDDPSITICAFCGCRNCFGKHNSQYLILCDNCDQEAHTYCLQPPLTEIPKGAWYCDACCQKDSREVSVATPNTAIESLDDSVRSSKLIDSHYDQDRTEVKSRGRPKGSGKGRGRPVGSFKVKLLTANSPSDTMVTILNRPLPVDFISETENVEDAFDCSIIRLNSALYIAEKMAKKLLDDKEKNCLNAFLDIASNSDIEKVFKVMIEKRENLQSSTVIVS